MAQALGFSSINPAGPLKYVMAVVDMALTKHTLKLSSF